MFTFYKSHTSYGITHLVCVDSITIEEICFMVVIDGKIQENGKLHYSRNQYKEYESIIRAGCLDLIKLKSNKREREDDYYEIKI